MNVQNAEIGSRIVYCDKGGMVIENQDGGVIVILEPPEEEISLGGVLLAVGIGAAVGILCPWALSQIF